MRSIFKSVTILSVIAVIVYAIVYIASGDYLQAMKAALTIYGGFQIVFGIIEKSELSAKIDRGPKFTINIHTFEISPVKILFLSTLMYIGLTEVPVGVSSLFILYLARFSFGFANGLSDWCQVSSSQITMFTNNIVLLFSILSLPFSFYVGRWIGWRSQSQGLKISFFAPIFTFLMDQTVSTLEYNETVFNASLYYDLQEVAGDKIRIFAVLVGAFIALSLRVGLTILGYFVGNSHKTEIHLRKIIRTLPPETQFSLLQLVNDEISRQKTTV